MKRVAALDDEAPVVVGVDGCRTGWVVATGTAASVPELRSLEVVPHIAVVLERVRVGEVTAVGIDMPFGLPESGVRACDRAARSRLGPRRSSVFPAPPRPLLGSVDYEEALRRSRAIDGRGLSIQAFNLLPKIAELDAGLDPDLAERVVEAHPESSFAAMAGAPLPTTKRTAEGRAARRELLAGAVRSDPALLDRRHRGAAPDDVLDAVAALWSTARWCLGTALVLGDGEIDQRGLPMRVAV
ncbi:MAG TPA: DUF429 domain-containing protein [Acidimicrobiales bacterium]